MAKCFLHPGRDSVMTVAAKNYCQKCKDGQQAAAAEVALKNKHVEPKSCFVTYRGGDTWLPFLGTGCAHWVAHQLDISTGAASNQCLEGHSIRVPDVIQGKPKIAIDDVAVNDIWANDALTHMGLVSKVQKNAGADAGVDAGAGGADAGAGSDAGVKAGAVQIQITHDSSGQGGVFTNDFATYFHGQGSFYR
jgi:hypothetical protein